MHLSAPTIRKFIRESLVTGAALTLDNDGVARLKKQLRAWFATTDELVVSWQEGPGNQGLKTLCQIAVKDPRYGTSFYGGFHLTLDAERKLHLSAGYRQGSHPVGSADELLAFLRLCQERVARMNGQHAKRNKVRKLRGAAVKARVQELARTFQFDFYTTEGRLTVELALRFDDRHIVELAIPYANFDEVLPQLEATLPMLRDLVRAGLSTRLRPNHAAHFRRRQWVLHQSLAQNEPTDP